MRWAPLLFAILILGCIITVPDEEGRPCLHGDCLAGYACHEDVCIMPGTGVFAAPVCSEDMCRIPEGSFLRGSDPGVGRADERPRRAITLSAFWIDVSPVTVTQYAQCVDAGACLEPAATEHCNFAGGREDHPVNCVSFLDAKSYCDFAEKRLPTEAEWEKAARATDARAYPWGQEQPSCELAVFNEEGEGWATSGGCGLASTWPAGAMPEGESPYGVLDMAGNVLEWVSDYYDPLYYERAPSRDPQGPASGRERALRGGSWRTSDKGGLRAAHRYSFDPDGRVNYVGFRCAQSAD